MADYLMQMAHPSAEWWSENEQAETLLGLWESSYSYLWVSIADNIMQAYG